ncbi:MAG: helix-turn-helix domain-containing protein [Candidatus Aenigmarchaeota archaeon]|nr:helix-turn-helix domain-containing protein [Candidatus Aenigmarchaeota archaeon]
MAVAVRRGREFYSETYTRSLELCRKGKSVSDIAQELGISYSCAYHWTKGLRKPDAGKLNEFRGFLEEHGPTPAIDIKEKFPKHNELFLTASKRELPVRRLVLKRKFGEYATWYFVDGQEAELETRVEDLFAKVKELQSRIKHALLQ